MAPTVKLKHTFFKGGKWRWVPPPWAFKLGARGETLGPELTDDAIARSCARTAEWERAKAAPSVGAPPGSLAAALNSYEKSEWYLALAAKTKKETDSALAFLRTMPATNIQLSRIKRKHVRKIHAIAAAARTPGEANKIIKWLRRVFSHAIECDLIETNPAAGLRLKHARPRRQIWSADEFAAFMAAAIAIDRPGVALAVRLGYDTSQRLGDILAATWRQYDGEGIAFDQAKTGAKVWTPLSIEGRAMLADADRDGVQIVINNKTAAPYTVHRFNKHFAQVRAKAKIRADLQFRDLRRTAASEVLAGGGRAEPLTGHRPGSSVLATYELPNKDAARASQAARKQHKSLKDGLKKV